MPILFNSNLLSTPTQERTSEMNTLICHKWGAFKYSEFVDFSFDSDGDLFICTKDNPPQLIQPYNENELGQFIRDGKLNSRDLGCLDSFGSASANSNAPKQDSYLPSLLFLVRDCQGNVKLCNAQCLMGNMLLRKTVGDESTAHGSSLNCGINFAAFIGNPLLGVGNAFENVSQNTSSGIGNSLTGGDDDEAYNEVVEFAIQTGKISASLIQRRFRFGYNRAARMMDLLESRGIVGPQNGSKPREVLVKLEKNDDE